MILYRQYVGNNVYSSLGFKIYQLVFEHNFTTSRCFKDAGEARNSSAPGKFSILYDLENKKYIMKDHFRHFIAEYPEIKLINSWKQINSPTEENEVPGQTNASGFVPDITELPMNGWGGLVHTNMLDINYNVKFSYLDGNPGIWT